MISALLGLKMFEKLERLSSKPSDIEVEKRKRFKLINENRERDRNDYIKKQICKWRLKTWYWVGGITVILLVCLACYLVLPSTEGIDCFLQKKSISLIGAFILGVFDLFVIKNLYDKYCNHSNINAFKMNIIVPEELKNLNRIEDMPN